jgi:hypothetical protein
VIVSCYICCEDFEIPFEEWVDIDEVDDYVCEDCADIAKGVIIARN